MYADVVELADTTDLSSVAVMACRFDAYYQHQQPQASIEAREVKYRAVYAQDGGLLSREKLYG